MIRRSVNMNGSPLQRLIESPAVRKASPVVRQWLVALLTHGERAGEGMPPKAKLSPARQRKVVVRS
jgi:hypothetical protein